MSGASLVIDRSSPSAPMLVAWVDGKGRTERALAVKAGKVLQIPADRLED